NNGHALAFARRLIRHQLQRSADDPCAQGCQKISSREHELLSHPDQVLNAARSKKTEIMARPESAKGMCMSGSSHAKRRTSGSDCKLRRRDAHVGTARRGGTEAN